MTERHVVVWMDHFRARAIAFTISSDRLSTVESLTESKQLHVKSGRPGSGHLPDDVAYFDAIVAAIGDAPEVLLTGPGTAKVAFERYVQAHHPALAHRILGVETLDHPSDGELLAHARKYFHRVDQLLGG